MVNCSLALYIPEYGSMMEITCVGSSTIDVSTIDVWPFALDDRVDAETLIQVPPAPHYSFTPSYNATEQLSNFTCE